jgi:hypothetical protein
MLSKPILTPLTYFNMIDMRIYKKIDDYEAVIFIFHTKRLGFF